MAYSGYDGKRGGAGGLIIIILIMHLVIISLILIDSANADKPEDEGGFNDQWHSAHATAYNTTGKACKNEKGSKEWNGRDNVAAVSSALFNNGSSCGQCYEIKCVNGGSPSDPHWCKPGSPSVTVMVTDLCRPNINAPTSGGGWCNPPKLHFAVAQAVWENIVANSLSGIVKVNYTWVQCS